MYNLLKINHVARQPFSSKLKVALVCFVFSHLYLQASYYFNVIYNSTKRTNNSVIVITVETIKLHIYLLIIYNYIYYNYCLYLIIILSFSCLVVPLTI